MQPGLSDSTRLPIVYRPQPGAHWQASNKWFSRFTRGELTVLLAAPTIGVLLWASTALMAPPVVSSEEPASLAHLLELDGVPPPRVAPHPAADAAPAVAPEQETDTQATVAFDISAADLESDAHPAAGQEAVSGSSTPQATTQATTWAPRFEDVERRSSDHPNLAAETAIRVRVVTVRARVTAYTAYDHLLTKPEWADGVVAWHPNGKKRRVENHPYGLATDWLQFPAGATYIRVPGYMEKSFPSFPQNFRVVDDACGQSRKTRRQGGMPVIDVRYRTRYSAINRKNGWGSRNLEVEVIFPEHHVPDSSLRPWIVKEAWHTYQNGELVRVETL